MLSAQLLLAVLQQYNVTQKNIWVAYSGGVDSHALLVLAKKCFPNVRAIHINHGTRAEDVQWQAHCTNVCEQLNLLLHSITVNATCKPAQSQEDAERSARRKAWQELLGTEDVLLVAHHAEDQAETILYRLLRGAGPQGLSGMQACTKLGAALLLRPLLHVSKQEILAFAKAQNLSWLEDISNQDNAFDRNYIRNMIMPLLQQRWPHATQSITRSGTICAQMIQGMAPLTNSKLNSMLTKDAALELKSFVQEDLVWQQEVLRAWLRMHDIIPSMQQLNLLKKQVIAARIDAMPELQIGAKVIKRSRNKLYVLDANEPQNTEFAADWDLTSNLSLPSGQVLQPQQVFTQPILDKLRTQHVYVRMGVLGRKAKKIFQEHAIPTWERNRYPLVFANNRLVGVVGLWSSKRLV